MVNLKRRRSVLFASGVTAVVLGLASVAFACSSNWHGEMIVKGRNGSATAIGSLSGTMKYCAGWPKGKVTLHTASVETMTVVMEAAVDGCTPNNGLLAGDAEVNIIPSQNAFVTDSVAGVGGWSLDTLNGDCHATDSANATELVTNIAGTKRISGGAAQWTVTWGPGSAQVNAAHKAAGLCVGEVFDTNSGMEVPIIFV